jgi:glycosyltransferase involved in cell wall biosynthesis
VIQEAFAAKVPVVASRLGALKEKVRDGVNGRLFEPGNPEALACLLQEIAEDPRLLDALRANIQPVTTVEQHVQELEGVYRSLIRQAQGS